jgi:hypothetical protein
VLYLILGQAAIVLMALAASSSSSPWDRDNKVDVLQAAGIFAFFGAGGGLLLAAIVGLFAGDVAGSLGSGVKIGVVSGAVLGVVFMGFMRD